MPLPPRLLVVGSLNYDLIFRHERLPVAGESLLGAEYYESCGGKGANQAVAAARAAGCLGADLEIAFAGAIGDDEFGRRQKRALLDDGVDVAALSTLEGVRTGTSCVWVESSTGQNRILCHRGANERFLPPLLDGLSFEGVTMVLMPNEIPAATLAAVATRARREEVPVLWNPAPILPEETLPIDLASLRFVTPNEVEAAALLGREVTVETAGEAVAELTERGAEGAAITLGKAGVVIGDQGEVHRLPAPSVEAVDTTGAGDAWNGAFAAAVAVGASTLEAALFAVRYATESVRYPGTQTAFPRAPLPTAPVPTPLPTPPPRAL